MGYPSHQSPITSHAFQPAMHNNPAHEPLPTFSEMAARRLIGERAEQDGVYLNFIGAGAYAHHIPAVVSPLAARGDFCVDLAAHPLCEVQGTLQLLYEYQTKMAALLALDVASIGASSGASALAEAVSMAVRLHKSARRVLMPRTLHPLWRSVLRTLMRHQRIELIELPYDRASGRTVLDGVDGTGCAALIISQPNFFGVLEPVNELTDWAHTRGLRVIGAVNPLALALLNPPGEWGERGADIAAGDVQPLGMPLSTGMGFIACRAEFASDIAGHAVVSEGGANSAGGYRLHTRGHASHVAPVAAAAYMAVMGARGLAAVASASAANAAALAHALTGVRGIERAFTAPMFHEFVVKLSTPAAPVLHALKAQGILGGMPLMTHFPEIGQSLLVCATETKTAADIAHYTENMTRIVGKRFQPAPCSIKQVRQP